MKYTPQDACTIGVAEQARKLRYDLQQASNDLAVIDWLLSAGAISREDALFMRNYVESLARC